MNAPAMWPHQRYTHDYLIKREKVYDASSPGTGKTRAHLEAFATLRKRGAGRALVVAPLSLLTPAWGHDISRFIPQLTVAYATAGKREEAFASDADIVMLNTDGVRWITETPHKIRLLKGFDVLIIDEASYFKHRTSARSKALRKIAPRFRYRWGLSGTPRTNSITDLWHQILVLDDGLHFGQSFHRFRTQFCIPRNNGFGIDWEDKPNANQLAMHLLQDMTIRHKFDDVMNVPPNYTRTIEFDLPPKLREQYLKLERESLLELQTGDVSAVNAAVLRNKILQLASGSVYGDHHTSHVLDTSRYELIIELVEEREHSIVFFNWRHSRDELLKLAAKRKMTHAYIDGTVSHRKRAEIVDAFQEGAYQLLLLQPETGAHGLTLTRGRTTIWASPQYKPDVAVQGLHRIYRGGQTKKTETILIQAADTVERLVYDKLQAKGDQMMGLLELIEKTQKLRDA